MDYCALPFRALTTFETPTVDSSLWIENISKRVFYAEHQRRTGGDVWETKTSYGVDAHTVQIIDDVHRLPCDQQRIICNGEHDHVADDDVKLFLISAHAIKQIPENEPMPELSRVTDATVIQGAQRAKGSTFDRCGIDTVYLVVRVINAIPGSAGGSITLEHSEDATRWTKAPDSGLVNGGIRIGGCHCYSNYRAFDEINPAGLKRFIRAAYEPSPYEGIAFRFMADVYFRYERREIT